MRSHDVKAWILALVVGVTTVTIDQGVVMHAASAARRAGAGNSPGRPSNPPQPVSGFLDFESLAAQTVVFEQFPGLQFPATPQIIRPLVATSSGAQALSNTRPGEEFNSRPLTVVFTALQHSVRLRAGLNQSSAAPITATLRAFDVSGSMVAQDGPTPIGPGPAAITTEMKIDLAPAIIRRIELEYSSGFTEVIDDLAFDTEGPLPPVDSQSPTLTILQPTNGAMLAGDTLVLAADIVEDRKLRSVSTRITSKGGVHDIAHSFHGVGPGYRVGPVWTGPLVDGANTITVTAEDFAGNRGVAAVTITVLPTQARLRLPAGPIEIPRWPEEVVLPVALDETFPGSLNARPELSIEVTTPDSVRGRARIPDYLNQPNPSVDLSVRADPAARLGATCLAIQASESRTGRVLSSAIKQASLIPARAVDCSGIGDTRALYAQIPIEDLTRAINQGLDASLAARSDITKVTDMTVTYHDYAFDSDTTRGELRVDQDFQLRVHDERCGSPFTASLEFVGDLVLILQPSVRLGFEYTFTSVVVHSPLRVPWYCDDGIEDRFRGDFLEPFRAQLEMTLTDRLAEQVPIPFLRDAFINSREFGIGFCIPDNLFPTDCPILQTQATLQPLAVALGSFDVKRRLEGLLETVRLQGGVARSFGGRRDTFISPLEQTLRTFSLETSEPLKVRGITPVYTGSGSSPRATIRAERDGRYTVSLSPAPAPGEWLKLGIHATAERSGLSANLEVWIAHLPGDVNQDGVLDVRDARAFSEELSGRRSPLLLDLNGDGMVDSRDVETFELGWRGGRKAQPTWRVRRLPRKPS